YDFKGWFTSASGTEKVKADTVVTKTSDHTLYAQYNANKYTVTYDPDGGTISEPSKEVTFGSKYGKLPTPVKNGYTFAGWFTAKTGGVQVKADTLVSSDNLDVNAGTHCLYARWNAKTITVSLDAGEGTCSKKNLTVTFAGKYTNLPDATPPDGMEFVGWFTDGNTNITADSTVTIALNHTLTARYRGDEVIVTFDVNGGSALPAEKRTKTVYVADTYGTLPVPTRTDHDFTGWYTKAEGGSRIFGSTTVTVGSAHTLYAHWKAKTCKVTLDANGGSFDDGTDKTVLEVQKNEVLSVSDLNSSYRPYYARHKFKKWSDSATVTVTSDMTLTAAWDAIGEEESEYRVEGIKAEGYEYTGSPIKPDELGEIVVYDNSVSSDRPLVEKVDYTLSYQNNKDVADKTARKAPTLIIKGKGNYEKSQEVKFSIVPVSIGDGGELKKGFSVTIADKQSNGTSEQKSKPTIKYGKTSLKEGKDYKITGYEGDLINPGTAKVCVEATGVGTNFTGTAKISYQIYDKDSNIGKMFVKAIPDQPYTGTEIADFTAFFTGNNIVVKPKQTSPDSDILECGTDYEVSYSPGTNRTEAGTVSLSIVGKGAFTGRKTVSFRIIPKDVSTCNVTVVDTGIVYNGKAQKPPVKVTIGSKELTEGTDYTLSYTRNTNAGAAALGESKAPMVTVKGRGNYKGAKKKTFTIGAIAVDRSELDVSVANVKVKEKAVKAKDIKATIKYYDPLRGKTVSMSKDKDFVIQNFNYAAGRQKQEVEFKLTGNYRSDSITAEFIAYKDNIPVDKTFKAKLADPGAVYEYTGEQIKPALTVTRTSGEDVITLVEGRDFKVSYSNNKNAAARTSSRAPMWTVTGTGAYKGTIGTGRFTIEKAVLSGEDYELQVSDVKQSSKPGEAKVKVISKATGKALSSSDYTCTYSDNTGRTDHAKVKVIGKGNFFSPEGEELVSEFRIYGTDISKLSFDKIPDQKYEGKTVKPAVVIKDRSTSYTLVPGVDYELKYGQNIRTGTGTVTINGIGIYGGSKTLSFKIKPKPIENKN
nr:InlB B-repeat-containing protein [Lachnospiraceae bacterium]